MICSLAGLEGQIILYNFGFLKKKVMKGEDEGP